MKHMKTIAIILISSAMLSGCAADMFAMRPVSSLAVVDMQGVDQAKYAQDMRDCEEYASRVDVQGSTANAAALGGLFGAVLGGMAGNSSTAGWVGLLAAGESAGQANQKGMGEVKTILKTCLTGRGYRVLN